MRRAYRLAPPPWPSHYRASLEEVRHIRIPEDFCVRVFLLFYFLPPVSGARIREGIVCALESAEPLSKRRRWRKGESATRRRPPMRVLLLSADASPMSHKSASATLKGRAFPPSPTLLPFSLPSCECLCPLSSFFSFSGVYPDDLYEPFICCVVASFLRRPSRVLCFHGRWSPLFFSFAIGCLV